MNCSAAILPKTKNGWCTCSISNQECVFVEPNSHRCAQMYQFGPDAIQKDLETSEISEEEIEDIIYDEEGSYDSIEEDLEDIING